MQLFGVSYQIFNISLDFFSFREITDSMFPEARKLAHLGISDAKAQQLILVVFVGRADAGIVDTTIGGSCLFFL